MILIDSPSGSNLLQESQSIQTYSLIFGISSTTWPIRLKLPLTLAVRRPIRCTRSYFMDVIFPLLGEADPSITQFGFPVKSNKFRKYWAVVFVYSKNAFL